MQNHNICLKEHGIGAIHKIRRRMILLILILNEKSTFYRKEDAATTQKDCSQSMQP